MSVETHPDEEPDQVGLYVEQTGYCSCIIIASCFYDLSCLAIIILIND